MGPRPSEIATAPFAESLRVRARMSEWRDRFLGWRDRLLADPRFQRRASRFPLTRPIARRRAQALFDLCAGFVYSQVLFAAIRLDLFAILADGPRSLAELAPRLRLQPERAQRLLDAAVALGLVERRGQDRYGLGTLGAATLGNPGVAAMVAHHDLVYADLADPVALLRREGGPTALSGFWAYASASDPARLNDERVRAYSALMSASNSFVADEVLDAYPFRQHRALLDVGGGDGMFAARVCESAPDLTVSTFDLPAVAGLATARFAAAGLAGRACAVGGDMLRDPLPTGCDVVTLVRILHDHDDAAALTLLRACRAALPAGGTIVVAEPMAGPGGAGRMGEAYLSLYLLAMGQGRVRSPDALGDLLRAAGFGDVRPVRARDPLLTGILVAKVDESSGKSP